MLLASLHFDVQPEFWRYNHSDLQNQSSNRFAEMVRLLSETFHSIKPHVAKNKSSPLQSLRASCSSSPSKRSQAVSRSRTSSSARSRYSARSWSVYLILSTNIPIKTYVGVTTNFSRRLKQHNGQLKGGAKASRAGRPWMCACIVRGFTNRSEACEFESKWKSFSRKMPRKKEVNNMEQSDNGSLPLLQHRQAALNRVKGSLECSHLEIDWKLTPSWSVFQDIAYISHNVFYHNVYSIR